MPARSAAVRGPASPPPPPKGKQDAFFTVAHLHPARRRCPPARRRRRRGRVSVFLFVSSFARSRYRRPSFTRRVLRAHASTVPSRQPFAVADARVLGRRNRRPPSRRTRAAEVRTYQSPRVSRAARDPRVPTVCARFSRSRSVLSPFLVRCDTRRRPVGAAPDPRTTVSCRVCVRPDRVAERGDRSIVLSLVRESLKTLVRCRRSE